MDLDALILDRLSRLGDASAGSVAAFVSAPTADVEEALSRLLAAGRVRLLPVSLTWAVADCAAPLSGVLDRATGPGTDGASDGAWEDAYEPTAEELAAHPDPADPYWTEGTGQPTGLSLDVEADRRGLAWDDSNPGER